VDYYRDSENIRFCPPQLLDLLRKKGIPTH
jgi:hypothetical protein